MDKNNIKRYFRIFIQFLFWLTICYSNFLLSLIFILVLFIWYYSNSLLSYVYSNNNLHEEYMRCNYNFETSVSCSKWLQNTNLKNYDIDLKNYIIKIMFEHYDSIVQNSYDFYSVFKYILVIIIPAVILLGISWKALSYSLKETFVIRMVKVIVLYSIIFEIVAHKNFYVINIIRGDNIYIYFFFLPTIFLLVFFNYVAGKFEYIFFKNLEEMKKEINKSNIGFNSKILTCYIFYHLKIVYWIWFILLVVNCIIFIFYNNTFINENINFYDILLILKNEIIDKNTCINDYPFVYAFINFAKYFPIITIIFYIISLWIYIIKTIITFYKLPKS